MFGITELRTICKKSGMIFINKVLLIYVIITIQDVSAKKIHLSDTEYAKMPPIGELENYGRCLREPGDMYCHLQFMLDSKEPSPLLELLKNVSVPPTTRYNHLKINRGICVSRSCKKYIGKSAIQQLDEDSFKSIIQTCVNESVWQEYRLEAHLYKVRHCESTKDLEPKELTLAQILVAVSLILILAINLIGSYYTSYVKKNNNSPASKFWMAFSIQENLRKVILGSESKAENFGSLLGMRCIIVLLVIFVHTGLIISFNIENEKIYEDIFDNKIYTTIANATILIDVFFVNSGFLLAYNYLKSQSKKKFTVGYFFRSVFNRFLRLTPTWAVILALICTWTPKFGSGPMWYELVVAESNDCKENWWKLLLYIGNFADFKHENCMHPTWFLAANMQVYLFSLIFIMFLVRYPKLTCIMFSSAIIIFMAIPSIIIYRKKLLPIFQPSPEFRRSPVHVNSNLNDVYITSYAHACAGVVGLIAGYVHYQIKQKGTDIRSWTVFNFLYKNSLIAILFIMYTGTYFSNDNYVYDAFIASVYSAVYRLTLSIFLAVMTLGAVNGCGHKIRRFFEFTPFQIMGRLSFSAYLVHMMVLRQYYGMNTAPYYASLFKMFIVSCGSMTVTFTLALIFSTLVENPVNELRSALTESLSNKEKEAKTK